MRLTEEQIGIIKTAFAAEPLRLVQALGLRVDDRKTKSTDGKCIWVFDGNEQEASLQIGGPGDKAGLCHRYGEGWSGNCFDLVHRVRPQDGFRARAEFVAQVYGITTDDAPRPDRQTGRARLIADTRYEVLVDGAVVAVHHRQDFDGASKRVWWESPDGTRKLPEGVELTELPLWRSWELDAKPGRPVVICEGEKDTDALASRGALAVGTYGADVLPSYLVLSELTARTVYLWPDNDEVGRKHMTEVGKRLDGMVKALKWITWTDAPPKAGAFDFFAAGSTIDDARLLLRAATDFEPPVPDNEPDIPPDAAQALADAVDAIPSPNPERLIKGAVPVEQVAAGIIERAEAWRLLPRKLYGMRSGWETLDWHYLGFSRESLLLISGMSGHGKTTIARHFLFASADAIMTQGLPDRLLFYPLEGGQDQLLPYWFGWKYGIPGILLEPGSERHMTDEWAAILTRAYSDFHRLPIDVCDSTKDADAILYDVDRRCSEGPIQGAVLDNIQELQFACGGNEYQNNKRVAFKARDIAEHHGITFIALTQVNTEGKTWKARGGPDWGNAATCRFHIERGEGGVSDEQRAQSNVTILHNIKRRYRGAPCRSLRLQGNWQTGRLWETETGRDDHAHAGARREAEEDPWHSN